jgi:hypothetical protein
MVKQEDPTETQLFSLVNTLIAGFREELSSFRWELRIFFLVFAILFAARDGVFAEIGIPGFTMKTAAASNVASDVAVSDEHLP